MARRLRHKARGACPLAPTMITCHAFGTETDCRLCDMIDMDAPITAVTLGNLDTPDPREDGEAAFWAHLARRTDGGPTTPAALAARLARSRYAADRRVAGRLRGAVAAHSELPVDAPF